MIQHILIYTIVIPITFILFNLTVFWVFTALKTHFALTLLEMTHDWIQFMKRGIPIPTDYERINKPVAEAPVLIRPVLRTREIGHLVK